MVLFTFMKSSQPQLTTNNWWTFRIRCGGSLCQFVVGVWSEVVLGEGTLEESDNLKDKILLTNGKRNSVLSELPLGGRGE